MRECESEHVRREEGEGYLSVRAYGRGEGRGERCESIYRKGEGGRE